MPLDEGARPPPHEFTPSSSSAMPSRDSGQNVSGADALTIVTRASPGRRPTSPVPIVPAEGRRGCEASPVLGIAHQRFESDVRRARARTGGSKREDAGQADPVWEVDRCSRCGAVDRLAASWASRRRARGRPEGPTAWTLPRSAEANTFGWRSTTGTRWRARPATARGGQSATAATPSCHPRPRGDELTGKVGEEHAPHLVHAEALSREARCSASAGDRTRRARPGARGARSALTPMALGPEQQSPPSKVRASRGGSLSSLRRHGAQRVSTTGHRERRQGGRWPGCPRPAAGCGSRPPWSRPAGGRSAHRPTMREGKSVRGLIAELVRAAAVAHRRDGLDPAAPSCSIPRQRGHGDLRTTEVRLGEGRKSNRPDLFRAPTAGLNFTLWSAGRLPYPEVPAMIEGPSSRRRPKREQRR